MESPTYRPHARQRSKSSFSFRSDKSDDRKSSGSRPKADLKEADGDPSKLRFSTQAMANPNRAINEDEPSSRAVREHSTLSPIRSISWKDAYGNPITDPDASNPSRSRLERPLDTIKSFEAAISRGERRSSSSRQTRHFEPQQDGYDSRVNSRRSSMVLTDPSLNTRSPFARQRSSQYPAEYYPPSPGGGGGGGIAHSPRPPAHRLASAPMAGAGSRLNPDYYNANPNVVYPTHSYRESHDTVITGESYGSSNNTEPWGNSTDPSSENSSVDRIQAPFYKQQQQQQPPPEGHNDAYGSYTHQHSPSPHRSSQYRPEQPSLPENQVPRSMIRLGSDAAPPPPPAHSAAAWGGPPNAAAPRPKALPQPPAVEKRKSWLKRTFSKG